MNLKDFWLLPTVVLMALGSGASAPGQSGDQTSPGVLGRIPDEVMPDTWMRRRIDPLERVREHAFTRERSVLDWRKAMPIGNGDVGAAVHGYPDSLTWHIGKNDVWWSNFAPEYEEVYPCLNLEEIRRRVRAGDRSVGREICDALDKQTAANGKGRAHQTSCARFTLQLCRSAVFYRTSERLDLERAVATSLFSVSEHKSGQMSGQVDSFVSRRDEVLAIRATPQGDDWGVIRFELSRDPMDPGVQTPKMTAEEMDRLYQPQPVVENGIARFTMDLRGEDAYSVALATDAAGLDMQAVGPDIFARGRTGEGPVTFYMAVVSNNDAPNHAAEARRRVEQARELGWDALLERHTDWWADFWRRSWVALPDSVQERPWYWGLYRAASARRPGKVCPSYTPPWQASNAPGWGLFILTYETTRAEMGLLATNHSEIMEPWLALLDRIREPLRPYVRKHFGVEGMCYPHSFTWRGYPIQTLTCDGHQGLAASGESVKFAWDYYAFTGDLEFLREVGYPMLKDVASFYRNYLCEEGDGSLVIFPSHYLESAVYLTNCLADVSMFRLVLNNAARAAEELGIDAELASDWRSAARRIPPYETLPDGRWKMARDFDPESVGRLPVLELHDLYPVSIGEEADAWHGSPEMRQQARATYEHYLGDEPYAWDLSLSFITAARMADRQYAAKILDIFPKIRDGGNINRSDNPSFPKGFGEDGGMAFCVDITSAIPSEFITELMLQSQGGDIRVFPTVPPGKGLWAFHSLRARGAFLVSAEMRDDDAAYVLILSLRGNPCFLAQPFRDSSRLRVRDLSNDKIVWEGEKLFDEVIEFDTQENAIYAIERSSRPLGDILVME